MLVLIYFVLVLYSGPGVDISSQKSTHQENLTSSYVEFWWRENVCIFFTFFTVYQLNSCYTILSYRCLPLPISTCICILCTVYIPVLSAHPSPNFICSCYVFFHKLVHRCELQFVFFPCASLFFIIWVLCYVRYFFASFQRLLTYTVLNCYCSISKLLSRCIHCHSLLILLHQPL